MQNQGYKETHMIFGNDCMIYTLNTAKRNNWYYRFKIAGESKYRKKSLKTTNKQLAINLATKKYLEMVSLSAQGIELGNPRVDKVWNSFIQLRVERFKSVKRYKAVWERYLKEYFGNTTIEGLTRQMFLNYWSWRISYWKRNGEGTSAWDRKHKGKVNRYTLTPSYSTLRREQSIMRAFMRYVSQIYVVKLDVINDICAPHKIETDGTRIEEAQRGRFWVLEDYEKFMNWLNEKCAEDGLVKGSKRNKPHRRKDVALSWDKTRMFIRLIATTGVRVEEATKLTFNDIIVNPDKMTYVWVRGDIAKPKQGVRRERQAPSFYFWKDSQGNVRDMLYQEIEAYRQKHYPDAKGTDYIFPSANDRNKPAQMTYLVRTALDKSGFLIDRKGKRRTATSFRHYFAQARINDGYLSLALIAECMGNTVAVLEETYAATSAVTKFAMIKANADKIAESKDIAAMNRADENKRLDWALRVFKSYK